MAEKTTKRGLGTGLSALFGDDRPEKEQGGALYVAIERVEPRADQPRTYFNEEGLQELADSIGEFGIIQPLTVRALGTGYYQIIAGERRWRAARLAGIKEVPVRVLEADDKMAMEMALVENLQREDLNAIEEAKGYKTLIDEYNATQEEISGRIGKSRSAVANALRLLNLSPPVMAMVEDGDISAGHARALLVIKDEGQQLRAAAKVMAESLSVRQTENLAGKVAAAEKKSDLLTKQEPESVLSINYLADAEKRLETAIGRRVKIKDGHKKGLIQIEYYGSDDRENLIDALLRFKHT